MMATGQFARQIKAALGRVLGREARRHFNGSYPSYAAAMQAIGPDRLAGYDHDEVADVAFEAMCRRELWDYPVLFWLERLLGSEARLLDVGGHMGTKFRAFRQHLRLPDGFDWAIYDVPAIVRAGRARASREGLAGLSFHDRLEDTPPSNVLLASGLLQYLDIPFAELLQRLPTMPRHLVLNKVATREGPTIVTLERFPQADVPYHVHDHAEFLNTLAALGYVIRDSWVIPAFSRCHPDFGQSTSRGFYAERTSQAACRPS